MSHGRAHRNLTGPDAPSAPAGYVATVSNAYGIALNSAWIEWAGQHSVCETVAAALYLIFEARPLDDIVATGPGKRASTQIERDKKFFSQNFAGMHQRKFFAIFVIPVCSRSG